MTEETSQHDETATDPTAESVATNEVKQRVQSSGTWLRLLYMFLFAVIGSVVVMAVGVIALFQFVHAILTGHPNDNLVSFSRDLGVYCLDIIRYLTYQSDDRPFPFAPWAEEVKTLIDEPPDG
ncbi:MAG: DUF4389 domain-containing protein [Gammaproteobacteria bacterium]